MKKSLLFIVGFYLVSVFVYGQKAQTLWNAHQAKGISVSAKWNSDGNHVYGRRLLMTVTNLKNEKIKILIPPGETFLSKNPDYQNQMVVKADSMILAAYATDTISVSSVCIGHEKQCPGKGEGFTLVAQKDVVLTRLATFISSSRYYNSSTAQAAVWTAQGSIPITSIYSRDSLMAWSLAIEVAKITGQPVPSHITLREHHIVVLNGNFNYQVVKPVTASLGVYDSSGNAVSVIINKQLLTTGLHTFKYYANEVAVEGASYLLKLISDKGEVLYSKVLSEKDSSSLETYSQRIIYPLTLSKGYKDVKLGIYDSQGNLMAEIFGYRPMAMGTYNINYTLHHDRAIDSVFYVRLVTRDEIIVAQKLIRKKGPDDDNYPEEILDIQLRYPVAVKTEQTKCVIYNEYGDEIAEVFKDKKLNAGPNEIKYTLKHTYGKKARFIVQVLGPTGQILFSKEIIQSVSK